MSELLQVIIMVAFAALCFGGGYLTAFIVTSNQWRGDLIKRGFASYNERTGKWEWGEQASRRPACLWHKILAQPLSAVLVDRRIGSVLVVKDNAGATT